MKTILVVIFFSLFQITAKGNYRTHGYAFKQDSICICQKDTSLKCCKKDAPTYYGNPKTLSAKEKMKYETMSTKSCCSHDSKRKKGKTTCMNCKREAVSPSK